MAYEKAESNNGPIYGAIVLDEMEIVENLPEESVQIFEIRPWKITDWVSDKQNNLDLQIKNISLYRADQHLEKAWKAYKLYKGHIDELPGSTNTTLFD